MAPRPPWGVIPVAHRSGGLVPPSRRTTRIPSPSPFFPLSPYPYPLYYPLTPPPIACSLRLTAPPHTLHSALSSVPPGSKTWERHLDLPRARVGAGAGVVASSF